MRANGGNPETAEFEPVAYRKKQRSGFQFSLEWAIKMAFLISLFIPLVLYKLGQEVSLPTVLIATMGGIAGVLFFCARWYEGAYDPPRILPIRRDRRE